MEQEYIIQTALDQMVGSDQDQLLKALIPYLPQKHQQLLSIYTKAREFSNTVALFQASPKPVQMQAASLEAQPLDILNDVRQYCFGNSRKTLDQMINMLSVLEMVKIMNAIPPEDNCKEERQ